MSLTQFLFIAHRVRHIVCDFIRVFTGYLSIICEKFCILKKDKGRLKSGTATIVPKDNTEEGRVFFPDTGPEEVKISSPIM